MGIFFTAGEKKTRPGVYQRYENNGGAAAAGAVNGIVAVTYQSDWGAVGEVVVVDAADAVNIDNMFGKGGTNNTVSVIKEAFTGGATTVKAVRLGEGGTKATADINDMAETPAKAVTITAKCAGSRAFKYAVRNVLGDSAHKEFVIIEGATIREKIAFAVSDTGEVDALVDAINANSAFFDAAKATGYAGNGKIAVVADTAITAGEDPTVDVKNYSNAFTALEPHRFNTICVDTNDNSVHALLSAYVDRVYKGGKIECFAVVGGTAETEFETRLSAAKAYNTYNTIYIGNGWYDVNDNKFDGYMAAARLAGMIAAIPSNQSLVHTVVSGAVRPIEMLTDSDYTRAINNGMIAFSVSASGNVWLDSAITTLVDLTGEDDEGWKKIKRAKIRKELMARCSDTVEPLIGRIDNDSDGQSNIMSAIKKGVLVAMESEKKLLAGSTIELDTANPPVGDSAWFKIVADDVDSIEKAYFAYGFRFSASAV